MTVKRKRTGRICFLIFCTALFLSLFCFIETEASGKAQEEKQVTLRICNWEEYIDLGDWDEEDTIDVGILLGKTLWWRILRTGIMKLTEYG